MLFDFFTQQWTRFSPVVLHYALYGSRSDLVFIYAVIFIRIRYYTHYRTAERSMYRTDLLIFRLYHERYSMSIGSTYSVLVRSDRLT